MRTTLTLDSDVAVQIEKLRRDRDASLKDVVNQALRLGLSEMRASARKDKPFRTQPIQGVSSVLSNLDNVAEVISLIEGEFHK